MKKADRWIIRADGCASVPRASN